MNSLAEPRRRGLHLVTPAAAKPETPKPQPEADDPKPDDKMARIIAEGVLKLQALQDEFDAEILSGHGNLDRVGELSTELNLVRERLRAHGVRVRA